MIKKKKKDNVSFDKAASSLTVFKAIFSIFTAFFAAFALFSCSSEDEYETALNSSREVNLVMGTYPQTYAKLSDSEIASLAETGRVFNGNKEYVKYSGERYVLVTAKPFASGTYFDDGTEIEAGKKYYFRLEPIYWTKIVNRANTNYPNSNIVFSNKVLDAIDFYSVDDVMRYEQGLDIYPSNYEFSKLRAFLLGYNYYVREASKERTVEKKYLNSGFYNLAFTAEEKLLISATVVHNGGSSTTDVSGTMPRADKDPSNSPTPRDYTSKDTADYLFSMSVQETTSGENSRNYYFSTFDSWGSNNKRLKLSTDYARAVGVRTKNYPGYYNCAPWWLRSPAYSGSEEGLAYYVDERGDLRNRASVTNESIGVVPAFKLVSDLK